MSGAQLTFPGTYPINLGSLMSGSGSNVRKVWEKYIQDRRTRNNSYVPVINITDNEKSNAVDIATTRFRDTYESGAQIPVEDRFQTPAVVISTSAIRRQLGKKNIDDEVKAIFDAHVVKIFKAYDVGLVVLGGYRWTTNICDYFTTLNVHPADLSVLGRDGKPLYIGNGWEPSAKAMLNGEREVRTSVHYVTHQLDGGAVAWQSVAVPIPLADSNYWTDKTQVYEGFPKVEEIKQFLRNNGNNEEETAKEFSLFRVAKELQGTLLKVGDHVVLPKAVDAHCRGELEFDKGHNIARYYGQQLPKHGKREA